MSKIMISRKRIWEIVEVAKPGDKTSRRFDVFILTLIFINVLAVIIGTVAAVELIYGQYLYYFEVFSVVIFTIEYFTRVWSCVEDEKYTHRFYGRLHFMVTPLALIDLMAVLPFYLPFIAFDLRFIRLFRLFRIFRVAKAARYVTSLKLFGRVFKSKKEELIITTFVIILLLIFTSSLMFFFENSIQPDKFPDIPSTMWWAVATLTTVGYGDVYPVTGIGKFLASIVAILGIGFFALPTGILGAGFLEEFQKLKSGSINCPHCGKELNK